MVIAVSFPVSELRICEVHIWQNEVNCENHFSKEQLEHCLPFLLWLYELFPLPILFLESLYQLLQFQTERRAMHLMLSMHWHCEVQTSLYNPLFFFEPPWTLLMIHVIKIGGLILLIEFHPDNGIKFDIRSFSLMWYHKLQKGRILVNYYWGFTVGVTWNQAREVAIEKGLCLGTSYLGDLVPNFVSNCGLVT